MPPRWRADDPDPRGARGERELELMSPVARGRFAWFTDQEVADVYAFLTDMSRHAAEAQ
jgi:cytochrome c1